MKKKKKGSLPPRYQQQQLEGEKGGGAEWRSNRVKVPREGLESKEAYPPWDGRGRGKITYWFKDLESPRSCGGKVKKRAELVIDVQPVWG